MTDPSTYADESDQPGLEWRARRRAACFGRRDKDGDDKVQNLPKSQTPSPSAYGSRRIYFDGEGRQGELGSFRVCSVTDRFVLNSLS